MSRVPIFVLAIAAGTTWSVQSYLQSRQEQSSAVVEAAARAVLPETLDVRGAREMSRPVPLAGWVDHDRENNKLRAMLRGPRRQLRVAPSTSEPLPEPPVTGSDASSES